MTVQETPAPVLASAYQKSVAEYWNREKNPVNLRLGEVDGFYHHHYGIGDVDWTVLDGPEETRDERITAELHHNGQRVNRKRVARVMRRYRIQGLRLRRRVQTTIADPAATRLKSVKNWPRRLLIELVTGNLSPDCSRTVAQKNSL